MIGMVKLKVLKRIFNRFEKMLNDDDHNIIVIVVMRMIMKSKILIVILFLRLFTPNPLHFP